MNKSRLVSLLCGLFLGSTATADDVDALLRTYRMDVYDAVGIDPKKLGSQNEILLKLDELGKKHLLPHKVELHQRAELLYSQLPLLPAQEVERGISLRIDRDPEFEVFEDIFRADGYGTTPFDYRLVATQWWDPLYAARTIRDVVLQRLMLPDQRDRRRFVDQFVPPLVYRQSDDFQQPVIAYYGSRELFVVKLAYLDDAGIYCLKRLDWYQLPRPE